MANSISYVFEAIDHVTSITRKITTSLEQVQQTVRRVNTSLKESSEKIKKMGESMSLYLSLPIIAFGYESVKAFNESAQAMAQVNAAIKSTGGAAGFTGNQFAKMADSLESKSLYDHSDILSHVTSQLLIFKKIHGETFANAQQTVIDIAAHSHRSLQEVSMGLGLALQDPTRGLDRLRRVGIIFTDAQKKVIDSLFKTGQVARAQGDILRIINQGVAGAAAAAAEAGSGPLIVLAHQFKTLQEDIGELIEKAIAPIIPYLREAIEYFRGLDAPTKKMILIIVGITAVVGPLIIGIGILGLVLSSVAATLAILASPITLIIAGIALLSAGVLYLYHNWQLINAELDLFISKIEKIPLLGTLLKSGIAIENSPVNNAPKWHGFGDLLKAPGSQHSSIDVNVNLHDRGNAVKSIQTNQRGAARVNVGRNMAHVG